MSLRIDKANLRDLGGMRTKTGKLLREMKLIRSGALYKLSESDWDSLRDVNAVIDLRSEKERRRHPDPVPEGTVYYPIEIMDIMRMNKIRKTDSFEEKVRSIIEEYKEEMIDKNIKMRHSYKRIALSENTAFSIEKIIHSSLGFDGAVLWHCSAGKDRTGVVTAIILELLQLQFDTIIEDYLYTNIALEKEIIMAERIAGQFSSDNSIIHYVKKYFSTSAEYLELAMDLIKTEYGTIEQYILERTDITRSEVKEFRDVCVIEG